MTYRVFHPYFGEVLYQLDVQDLGTMREYGLTMRTRIMESLQYLFHGRSEAATIRNGLMVVGLPTTFTELTEGVKKKLPSFALASTSQWAEIDTSASNERLSNRQIQGKIFHELARSAPPGCKQNHRIHTAKMVPDLPDGLTTQCRIQNPSLGIRHRLTSNFRQV